MSTLADNEFEKDPGSTRTFVIDWTDFLASFGAGVTISTSVWTVPTDLTATSPSNTTTKASVKLAGGYRGKDYHATNRITASNGEVEEQTLIIKVRDK